MMSYDGFISYSHAADGLLAPRLQAGLQKFAKPWWKRRAVRIFRDESSLSANPHLWSSITEALDTSGWFVLLLSPDAAESEWVGQEIAYWTEHRDANKILPVVTDGTFSWAGADVAGSAVPDVLRGVFSEEPRWVDVRWAKDEDQLDLKDPRFADSVADIASTVRGVPKDDLASEEVRQHRRTIRTAWAAGGLVTTLAIAATAFAVQAADNADEAETQAEIAAASAAEARSSADEAQAQKVTAEAEAQRADSQASLARSRELTASAISVVEADPELSILLALQSIEESPADSSVGFESMVALRRAITGTNVLNRIDVGDSDCFTACVLSPDGSRYVVYSPSSDAIRLFDTTTWEELWTHHARPGDRFLQVIQSSDDGRRMIVAVEGKTASSDGSDIEEIVESAAVEVLDTATGAVLLRRSFDGCLSVDVFPPAPDGSTWVVQLPSAAECAGGEPADVGRILLLESATLETVQSFDVEWSPSLAWLPDGERVLLSVEPENSSTEFLRLIDVGTGQALTEAAGRDSFFNVKVSPDGSLVAAAQIARNSVWLFDTQTMTRRDTLAGLPDAVEDLVFTADGRWLIAGSAGDTVIAWDLDSGAIEHELTTTGPGWAVDFDDDRRIVYVGGPGSEISVWDLSGSRQGEIDTVPIDSWVQSNSIVGTRDQAAFTSFLFPDFDAVVRTFGPESGRLEASIDVNMYWAPAVLPDGRIVAFLEPSEREAGPVVVWDPASDAQVPLVGCRAFKGEGPVAFLEEGDAACVDGSDDWLPVVGLWVDPAGDRLLISTATGEMLMFDAHTLEPIDRAFFDDGSSGVEAFGGGWIVFSDVRTNVPAGTTTTTIVEAESFATIAEMPGAVPEISEDGSRLALHDLDGGIDIYDTATWELVRSLKAGQARIRGLEFSPDGSMLASGAVDGFLRIWDVEAGVELHRIPIESPSDAYWIDDEHLVVGTQWGLWTTITLDTNELVDVAIDRLTRGFTVEECTTYRIDPCPTLDEMRSR